MPFGPDRTTPASAATSSPAAMCHSLTGPPPVRQLGQRDVFGGEVVQLLLLEVVGLHAANLPGPEPLPRRLVLCPAE